MTTQEIEIAIAATRGFTPRVFHKDGNVSVWWDASNSAWPDYCAPQYTKNINDILGWTKQFLKGKQPITFIRHLVAILDRNHGNADVALSDVCDPVEMAYHILVAEPIEFCEAFLRTLELWKE